MESGSSGKQCSSTEPRHRAGSTENMMCIKNRQQRVWDFPAFLGHCLGDVEEGIVKSNRPNHAQHAPSMQCRTVVPNVLLRKRESPKRLKGQGECSNTIHWIVKPEVILDQKFF